MATTQVTTVKVDELSKYGLKSNGEYLNWSKTLKEDAKVPVVPGRTFQMELYVADSGKRYINKVLDMIGTTETPNPANDVGYKSDETPAKKSFVKKAVEKATGEAMTRADWDSKDTRISRQGAVQAAVQAVAHSGLAADLEALYDGAEVLANKMLEFVNRK